MRVLVACEESQEVCKAFRELGHEAYSCDIQECSGGHPEWHLQVDALELLKMKWDLIIAHPPCTYLTNAGARWLWAGHKLNPERYQKGIEGKAFFMEFYNADCARIAIENPVPASVFNMPQYTQVIQPYEFGHPYSKKTCLWLKGIPKLKPTKIIENHVPFISSGTYSKTHDPKYKGVSRKGGASKSRSKTFPGIAKAMAEQWGGSKNDPGRTESRGQAPGVQAHQGEKAQIRAVPVRAQCPPVGERAEGLGGVLQALRTGKPLGARRR